MRIESDVPCEVFKGAGDRWRAALELITDSIVFIDEENQFIRQKEFAETVRNSTNYYVLITRGHCRHCLTVSMKYWNTDFRANCQVPRFTLK